MNAGEYPPRADRLLERDRSVSRIRENIAAVVVTYNRKELLAQCLDSLLKQSHPADALYLIDNHSTDGTYDWLREKHWIAPLACPDGEPRATVARVPAPGFPDRVVEIHYVRMPENTGGAGGFHEGMKRAVAAGCDWLWLMDDDLWTAPDALEVLVRTKDARSDLREGSCILNSLVLLRDPQNGPGARHAADALAFPLQELSPVRNPKTGICPPKRGIYHWRLSEVRSQVQDGLYRWICPFNGTFLAARIVTEIGLPNRDFFIWGDEKDFLWRAARRFDFYTVVDSRVFHPPVCVTRFDWKQYYHIRNSLVVNRHLDRPVCRNLKLILRSLALGLRHGRRGLALVLQASADGLAGRLGKRQGFPP